MSTGSISLATYPHELVRIACRKCDRRGQYRRAALIKRFGSDRAMPDLLRDVAAGCPKMVDFGTDRCAAHYPDLSVAPE